MDVENHGALSSAHHEPRSMHLKLFSLRFTGQEADFEELFQKDYIHRTLPYVRIASVLGILMYGAFGILDALVVPDHKYTLWLIRYALVCPAILMVLVATYYNRFHRYLQPLMSCLFAMGGMGIVVMIAVIPPPVSYYYYAGLILVFIFGYSFIYLHFLWAALSGSIIVIAYELTAFFTNTPSSVLISNNFFLISANIAGMLVCYNVEHAERRKFFLMHLLEQEQRKILEINEQLEKRVAERTESLENTNRRLAQEINEHQLAEQKRRELEERLHRSEKMEALGILAGGVAHDLNNVLGVIVGYAELLNSEIDEANRLKPHVQNIQTGGERAAAIVQDMLTLARRGVRTEKVVNLNSIINDYQQSLEFERLCSFHRNVQIKTELDDNLLNIFGSPVHLSKTIINLVSNAAEAMPQGGVLTVTTYNTYLDRPIQGYEEIQEGEYAVLAVSDTGTGIPADSLRHIFEPFYTKKVMGRSGTGLGLAVVWGTVKDHEGYIDVHSEEEKGSTFTIYFPVTRKETTIHQTSFPLADYVGHSESVLIVDDVKEQLELATRMLEKLNYKVTAVSSGENAVEYLRNREADLIILDMIMDPGMDGLETYK